MANDDHGCALSNVPLSDRTPEAGAAPVIRATWHSNQPLMTRTR